MGEIAAGLARGLLAAYSQIYRLQEAEIELVSQLPRRLSHWRPGWDYEQIVGIDIGANVGAYAYAMTRVCRKVLALEPNSQAASLLARANLDNCELLYAAASNRRGMSYLWHASRRGWRRPTAQISDQRPEDAEWTTSIDTIVLDELVPKYFGNFDKAALIMKIDIEGHESLALSGMRELLEQPQIVIIVEVEDRGSQSHIQTFQLLLDHGMSAYRLEKGELRSATVDEVEAVPQFGAGRLARLQGHKSNFVFLKRN